MFSVENAFTKETKEFDTFRDMRDFLLLHHQLSRPEKHWYPVLEDTSFLEFDEYIEGDVPLQGIIDFYTTYFPVMIDCDGIHTLVIPGRSIPVVIGYKMLLDLEDIPRFEAMYAYLRAENDPAVLKEYLPQINKIRENVSMEDVDFELDCIWTGWFEDFVKKENPAFADKTAFLRSFDRWAVTPICFEENFHIDGGKFLRAVDEHYELIHKILPECPGTDSPAAHP